MNIVKEKLKDRLLLSGLAFIAVSLLVFCIPLIVPNQFGDFMGFFMVNYILSVAYAIMLWYNRTVRQTAHKNFQNVLLLILFLISAYSLNRLMDVFSVSTTWLSVLLVLISINYILCIFFSFVHRWIQYVMLFIIGISTVLFLYMSVYLMPLYLLSIPGMLVLGVSIHSFVPVFSVFQNFSLMNDLAGSSRKHWSSFGCGIAGAVIISIVYTVTWSANINAINKTYNRAIAEGGSELPAWLKVAQYIPANDLNNKILKAGLVYNIPDWSENMLWRMPDRSLGEMQKWHDPLVVIASAFSPRLFLNSDEKVNILKSEFSVRHHTEERLWTGKDLATRSVSTNVQIWPESHIAYTEKIISVFNYTSRAFGNQQEAIYTFHLPEGAVVTSLSLWIHGKEEKSVLTTKGKAQEAYRAIVGIESHDPSVVHWQEGNQVTVRVFPVLSNEQRIFKVGITSPLRKEKENLVYDNIWFEGPDASGAKETVAVRITKPHSSPTSHAVMGYGRRNAFERSGNYEQHWSYSFKDEGLSPQFFAFNGNRYFLKPYKPAYGPVAINNVFLDINNEWTKDEFDEIWKLVKMKKVWVHFYEPTLLTEQNKDGYFRELALQKFTLFPIFEITDPAHSLLVTKSGSLSPDLSDLQETGFLEALKNYASTEPKINCFNFGSDLSPYLSSLKDYRFFNYEKGSLTRLSQLLSKNIFVKDMESENEIIIHNAEVSIVKQAGNGVGNAPDHLQRLFAYNHILRQYGNEGIGKQVINDTMIHEAEEANIVSPVSSLIVLETQRDYDRFDIKKAAVSLDNASLEKASVHSNGAVPEPHEWVLIIMGLSVGVFLLARLKVF